MRAPVITERTRRLQRLADGPVRAGMLGIGEAAALADVGFDQVSEVIGAAAFTVPPRSFFAYGTGALYTPTFPPGWQGTADGGEPVVLTSSTQRNGRVPTTVTAIRSGYRTALKRLTDEVTRVGADGAIDVQVARSTIDNTSDEQRVWNFLATGTAVRSRGRTRAAKPFTCSLSGAQTAAAMRAGWLPVQYLSCPVMAARWIEPAQRRRNRAFAPNAELEAYTKAVNACRHQARTDFAAAAASARGEGAIMSDMTLEISPALDLAQVTVLVTGTALTRFSRERAVGADAALSMADIR